jgi:hypothetical protein
MKILYVGDIVGAPGRRAFTVAVSRLRQAGPVDFIVANAENAAGGRGLTPEIAQALFSAGADVLTLGDHAWDQKDIIPYLDREPRVLRPANLAPGCPGKGWISVETPAGTVSVLLLIGRVFMPPHADCPFRAVDALLDRVDGAGNIILAELHAEATSEKIAFGYHLNGRVSAVVGTHTHVQTSDEKILSKGTAYLTDLGMTGPKDSVLGRDVPSVLQRFITGMPTKFDVAERDVVLEGALVEVDDRTGRATAIRRVREPIAT